MQVLLNKKDERKNQAQVCDVLDLLKVREKEIGVLSGGELQRFAIAMVCIQNADM